MSEKAILALKERLETTKDHIFKSSKATIQNRTAKYLTQFNKNIKTDDRKNKVVVHTLRHTFASHLAINGTPILTIKKPMNHKDLKATMIYAKLSADSGREAVEKLYIKK